MEFTQCLISFGVKCSPLNRWPRCPPHLAQVISVRLPSASRVLFIAPDISSSKDGQPQVDSNFCSEVYSGASHCLQTYLPFAVLFSYSPVKGASVPLPSITLFSSSVNVFNFIYFELYYIIIVRQASNIDF